MPGSEKSPTIFHAARSWWEDVAARDGTFAATRALLRSLWEFARDSTPTRLRQRYGDVDYDWDHRVNTTSAAVGWRDRLLGVFYSPYQPSEPDLFHEILGSLHRETGLRFEDFAFVDLGSGKGRALLMASDYPFRRILGVELLPALHAIALENLRVYDSESQRCFSLEAVCADATAFPLPDEPLVIYLFNPFPEAGLRRVMKSLEQTLRNHPRKVYVLYHNPLLQHVVLNCGFLDRIGGTHQYSIFRSRESAGQ
jgi:SAM-dependent methyltransferase